MTAEILLTIPKGYGLKLVGWKYTTSGEGFTLRKLPSNAPYYKEHLGEMVPVYELVFVTMA